MLKTPNLENKSKRDSEDTMQKLVNAIRNSKRVYVIGNGGSAANAIHLINDLIACGIKAYTLDIATLTATANDYSYEEVFSRWLKVVGESGDLLIALSGSGTSKNIMKAIDAAETIGMNHILITDYLRTMDMQQSEERQLVIGHEVMRQLRADRSC